MPRMREVLPMSIETATNLAVKIIDLKSETAKLNLLLAKADELALNQYVAQLQNEISQNNEDAWEYEEELATIKRRDGINDDELPRIDGGDVQ
jgi:hypothetical protein